MDFISRDGGREISDKVIGSRGRVPEGGLGTKLLGDR